MAKTPVKPTAHTAVPTKDSSVENFTIDANIIYSIISNQAGSLGKAFLECVMNSVDAGATQVDIQLTKSTAVITDDGKGFKSRQEIREWFGKFGFFHAEGSRKYGQFGLGRGQLWSFASTLWLTNEFSMDVDIKNRGLNYEVNEEDKPIVGTSIHAKFYTPLTTQDILTSTNELRELCQYAPIPILINGEVITVDFSKEKWTAETTDAYFRFSSSQRSLTVYNQGVLVRSYPAGQFGIGGVIVTKDGVRLTLNMARNDIIVSTCNIWKRIKKTIELHSNLEVSTKKKPMTLDQMAHMSTRMLSDSSRAFILEARGARVFTDITGRNHTYDSMSARLLDNLTLSFGEEGNQLAETVHRQGKAFVLHFSTLDRFNCSGLAEFIRKMKTMKDYSYRGSVWGSKKLLVVEDVSTLMSADERYRTIAKKSWTAEQKALMAVAEFLHGKLYQFVLDDHFKSENATEENVDTAVNYDEYCWRDHYAKYKRRLFLGASDVALAWTDGSNDIHIDEKHLKKLKTGMAGMHEVMLTLLHEYSHNTGSGGSHNHDVTFYKMYHDLSLYNQAKLQRAVRMTMQYMSKMMPKLNADFLTDLSFIERLEESELAQINKQAELDKAALVTSEVVDESSAVVAKPKAGAKKRVKSVELKN